MMTGRPASASSAAATSPASPAPTTMASASTPFPQPLLDGMLGCYRNGKQIGAMPADPGYRILPILSHHTVFSVLPMLYTVAAMVAPIPAAISAYSIAVAPL